MSELLQITPFVLCASLARQSVFYCDTLGFEKKFQADNYAFLRRGPAPGACAGGLRRGKVAVRLLECPPNPDGRPLGSEHSFYIDVREIDALYDSLRPMLDKLPTDRVRAPFDQPYGQREFHVLDEDGALVFFGESISV